MYECIYGDKKREREIQRERERDTERQRDGVNRFRVREWDIANFKAIFILSFIVTGWNSFIFPIMTCMTWWEH